MAAPAVMWSMVRMMIVVTEPRLAIVVLFDDYRLDGNWLSRHARRWRRLHDFDDLGGDTLLVQRNDVSGSQWCHQPIVSNVCSDQLWGHTGLAHRDHLALRHGTWPRCPAELRRDLLSVACVDFVEAFTDRSAGHCTDSGSNHGAGTSIANRIANDGT